MKLSKYSYVTIGLVSSVLLMIGTFIVRFTRLPPQIALFYSVAEGDDQIVDVFFIFILPLIMFVIIGLNRMIQRIYFKDNDFVKQIFYYMNISVIGLLTLIFLRIIFLIT